MGDVYLLASRPGELPCDVVYEDGLILCLHNQPLARTADPRSARAARAPFTALAVEPSGERVALSDRAGNLVLLDLAAQGYRRVRNMGAEARALAFSRAHGGDGALYCVMGDATVRGYDAATGDQVCGLQGHREDVRALAQTGDGALLLSASADKVLLWDVRVAPAALGGATEVRRRQVLDAAAGVAHAAVAPAAGLLAVCFRDDRVVVWRTADFSVAARLELTEPEAGAGLSHIALSDDGSVLVAAADNACVYVWDVARCVCGRI